MQHPQLAMVCTIRTLFLIRTYLRYAYDVLSYVTRMLNVGECVPPGGLTGCNFTNTTTSRGVGVLTLLHLARPDIYPFRPYRVHRVKKMRPLATHVAWSVCLSVGYNREPCKTAEPIKMPFGLWNRVGRRNRISGGDPTEGEILGICPVPL